MEAAGGRAQRSGKQGPRRKAGGDDECPWDPQDSDVQYRGLHALRHRGNSSFIVVILNGEDTRQAKNHALDVPLRQTRTAGGQTHLGRADRRLAISRADGWRQRDISQLRILQPGGPVGRGEPRGRAGRGSGDGPEARRRGPRPATGARGGDDAATFGEESAAHAQASRVPELSASREAGGGDGLGRKVGFESKGRRAADRMW